MAKEVTYQDLQILLKEAGLKVTSQRLFILEALHNLNHPSAEDIYGYVSPKLPGLSLGTVYKSLDTLVSNNLAAKVHSDGGNFRYDCHTHSHNHIYCSNTREIFDFEDPELKSILENYFSRKHINNIRIKDIRLHISAEKINPDKEIKIKS